MKSLLKRITIKKIQGDQIMKTENKASNKWTRYTGQAALMLVVLSMSGCFKIGGKDSNLLAGGAAKVGDGEVELPVSDIAADPFANLSVMGTTAVKNFLQIGESMSVVTGIPVSDNTAVSGLSIRGFISANQGSFSATGRADSVSAAMLKSVATLAGLYCVRALTAEKLLAAGNRRLFRSVTFPGTLTSLSAAVISNLNNDLASAIWQRQASAAEQTILSGLVTGALSQTTNSAGATLSVVQRHDNALLGVCIAALSSLDFLKS